MAERRMFAKTIIDSDAFLSMSLSAQALYFHLAMRADDEGFINNPKKIMRIIGANESDMKQLITLRYVLFFESGVIVIKHWRIHNYIQSDRFKETLYKEEKAKLVIKENKSYTEKDEHEKPPIIAENSEWIQNGYSLDTQYSIDKNSIDKNSKEYIKKKKLKKKKAYFTRLDFCYKQILNILGNPLVLQDCSC